MWDNFFFLFPGNYTHYMRAFASWSGGKDCTLALHRFLNRKGNEVACLVNMCEPDSGLSRSHGLSQQLIKAQADCLGIPLIQPKADFDQYEETFKKVLTSLRNLGFEAGVFGDIYLMEHRTWIERVCAEVKLQAVFPLWGEDTQLLLQEFIAEGFNALTVSIQCDKLPIRWLGRELDQAFYNDITCLPGIDPCAENGEYHSFVYNGPLFSSAVPFQKGKTRIDQKHYFLELN